MFDPWRAKAEARHAADIDRFGFSDVRVDTNRSAIRLHSVVLALLPSRPARPLRTSDDRPSSRTCVPSLTGPATGTSGRHHIRVTT